MDTKMEIVVYLPKVMDRQVSSVAVLYLSCSCCRTWGSSWLRMPCSVFRLAFVTPIIVWTTANGTALITVLPAPCVATHLNTALYRSRCRRCSLRCSRCFRELPSGLLILFERPSLSLALARCTLETVLPWLQQAAQHSDFASE